MLPLIPNYVKKPPSICMHDKIANTLTIVGHQQFDLKSDNFYYVPIIFHFFLSSARNVEEATLFRRHSEVAYSQSTESWQLWKHHWRKR